MKPIFKKFLLAAASLTLAATAATAAPWPPSRGDLLLGVQATGSTGATTNVFFNLGPAHALRDNPSPAGVLVNLDDELTAAFGAGWAARTDLYFGVIGVKSKNPPIGLGIGAVEPENGDPGRTIYVSRGTTTPGASIPWSGFSVSALGSAANNHHGQVDGDLPAINHSSIVANGDGVATVSESANPVQWNNSWTNWNPVPGPAYAVFTGGIQAQMGNSSNHVDLHRIVSPSGSGSYVTTITISSTGDVTVARAGAAATYFTVTTNATDGSVAGGGPGILYASGTNARLTAAPAIGFSFTNWSGDASGSVNPLTLAIDGNKNVTANFASFPSVTSPTSEAITATDATLGGNVTSDGGLSITERGVVFAINSANSSPRIGGTDVTKTTAAGTTGVFTAPVTGLTAGTTYAFAAYATSAVGTGYSAVARFTTDTTVNFTGGVGTVSNRSILAGDTQRFNLSIANPTTVQFSSTGATDLSWALRDSSNNPVSSGTGSVSIASLLAAGSYSLTLTSTGSGDQTVSLLLNASNVATARPDVSVGPSSSATIGANRYAPVAQRVTIISRRAAAKNGYARVGNDGALPDRIRVSATRGNSSFKVTYFAPGNVTASITRNAFLTPVLSSSSAPVSIRANVAPVKRQIVKKRGSRTTYLRKTFTSTIRGTALSSSARFDAAQIIVKTQ